MTEGHESDFLVTVRAQVMTRDESTEGWLPLAGGGLANVSIRKRARLSPGAVGHEYIIYGQRISDQSVILSCVINRDLKYYKVMPTFHHWRAGKQRNGLTFQTAADARAFDKGVLRAYNELIDGLAKSNPSIICPPLTKYDSVGEDDVFMTLDLPVETDSMQKLTSSPDGSEKSHKSINGDRGERSEAAINGARGDNEQPQIHYISGENASLQPPQPPPPPSLMQQQPQQQQQLPQQQPTGVVGVGGGGNITTTPTALSAQQQQQVSTMAAMGLEAPPATIAPGENYSYVTLTAVHDYNYPVVDQPVAAPMLHVRRESITALKKHNAAMEAAQQQQSGIVGGITTPLSANTAVILKDPDSVDLIKKHYQQQQTHLQMQQQQQQQLQQQHHHHLQQQQQHLGQHLQQQRVRCRYCHELYTDEWNRKGACEFAPDRFRAGLECVSGMGCARCMLYHCMSDAEGETAQHPCACDCGGGGGGVGAGGGANNNDAGNGSIANCTKRWLGLALLSLVVPCLWCYPPLRACHWLGVACGICGGRHKPQV